MSGDEVVISPGRGVQLPRGMRRRSVWSLTLAWIRRDLRSRYRQSVLRSWWSFLQPVAILATYGWVLTAVLDVSSGEGVPYLTFAWAGLVPFTFVATSLGTGVGSVQQAGGVISRVWFPREVLPISVVGVAAVDLGIMLVTLVAVSWVQVGPPTVHLLGLVPVLSVVALWTVAVTVLAAGLTVFRRDLVFAVPLALRLLFIVTPVMYPASLVADVAPWLNVVNPLTVAVEGTRDAVYRGTWPDPGPLAIHAAAAGVLAVAAFALFRRLEPTMADQV